MLKYCLIIIGIIITFIRSDLASDILKKKALKFNNYKKTKILDIPPRFMWGWGSSEDSGYCGSASTQTMGLFYGNWISE